MILLSIALYTTLAVLLIWRTVLLIRDINRPRLTLRDKFLRKASPCSIEDPFVRAVRDRYAALYLDHLFPEVYGLDNLLSTWVKLCNIRSGIFWRRLHFRYTPFCMFDFIEQIQKFSP